MALKQQVVKVLAKILWKIEKLFQNSSLVGNPEFFESETFPWVKEVEDNWETIRTELDEVLKHTDELPNFQDISPDQKGLTSDNKWKTFFFYAYGFKADGNCARCPKTDAIVNKIPGMKTAFFSILAPNKHIRPHRGPYKGVIRYHLGVKIPNPPESCAIRVGSQTRSWEQGKSLIFDDTYDHEAWNNSDEYRVVLFVDFVRPMKPVSAFFNNLIIKAIAYSPYVKGAKGNYTAWEKQFEDVMSTQKPVVV